MGDNPLVGGAEPALGRVLVVGVQHRVGVTVPIVAVFPARRGQQAFAFAAIRVAAGDLPADVAGIGKHQVQGDGADLAAGVRGFLDALRTGQVEKRIKRFVVSEVRCLQRQTETAALCQTLGAVEQWTMACFVHGFANRPLAFDEIGFVARYRRLPFAVGFVGETVALAADFFQEQILVVAHDAGRAPRHFAVETAQHHRQTGNGHAGSLILRCAYLHIAEQRRHAHRAMAIAGQQAFTAAAALRGDRPVVRRSGAEQIQVRELACGFADVSQSRNLSIELDALQLFAFGQWQFFVGSGRRQPRQFVGGERLREHQRGNLFRQVGGLAEVQQAENQRRIFRLPVFRLVAAGGEVRRQLVAVAEQVSVDPASVNLKEALETR
ncbi:hypothetical protein D3C72_897480 [compost metagenome]